MKSLRHPNIVKLVGVCWEPGMMACCLEYVENGSLEDWIRRTAGGKIYDPSKDKKKKGKKKKKAEMPLAESVYRGYDHDGKYDEALHSSEDKRQLEAAKETIDRYHLECHGIAEAPVAHQGKWAAAAKKGDPEIRQMESSSFRQSTGIMSYGMSAAVRGSGEWKALLKPDKSPLDHNAHCWWRMHGKCGEAVAIVEVSASPAHIFGLYTDRRRAANSEAVLTSECIEHNITTELNFLNVPAVVYGMHDRESLARGVVKKLDGCGFMEVHYQVLDERKPIAKNAKRVWSEYVMVATEKAGSGGNVSELRCMLRVDLKLGGVAALINGVAAKSSTASTFEPIIVLKMECERLLEEYEPALEGDDQGVVGLTWKGQLLGIATQVRVTHMQHVLRRLLFA